MTVVVQESILQKARIQKLLDELPDEIPLDKMEEFIDQLRFLHGLEQGRDDIRNRRGINHEEVLAQVKKKVKKWSR